MISLKRNPFSWDKQNIGKILTPTVTNVKLLSDGKQLHVVNIPANDELYMEIPTPKTTLVSKLTLKYTKTSIISPAL